MTNTPTCALCGDPVTAAGRTSDRLGGRRWCMKTRCRSARQRAYRDAVRREELGDQPMEIRPCFHCGDALPARTQRVNDSPVGRWCQKAECQYDRKVRMRVARHLEARPDNPDPEVMQMTTTLLRKQYERRGQQECPECGHLRAVPGYRHPDPRDPGAYCRAGGSFPARGSDIDYFTKAGVE